MFEYSTMNQPCKVLNRDLWGAHINPTRYAEFSPEYPDWLNPHQKQEWRDRGLVIWDATTQVVTHLYTNYALKILEKMKDSDTWKTDGCVIGLPAYRMLISETLETQNVPIEHHQDGWVLINKISLSSEQMDELLKFLMSEEHLLVLLAADDEKDIREACVMVVDLLIDLGRKKKVAGK